MLSWLGARPFVPFAELAGRLVLEDDNARERQGRNRNPPRAPHEMGVAQFYPLPFEGYRERDILDVERREAHGSRRERKRGRQEDQRHYQSRTPFQRSQSIHPEGRRRSPSRGRSVLSQGAADRRYRAVRSRSSARREQPAFGFPPQKQQRGLSFERYLSSRL
ncbi:hypothetical protein PHYSODRAFT_285436 [Phytophthora sojae]|uniref:Uncharacterized protein n=1 Tax=Phytophthora sojae (strain P6497) TaxID=1094619 RepID=G4Z922_PHYSP|nr:hypothetical protein PHYSODRAFT_285435 [Phytophthora sojae]XP_009523206.1 hypothetical protein PHYSODRAFT_285436 [Phytophthora sojae]EGZ20483.1 hypothetical protein PHYSODRAFT_285435 [Phytophthora sojae]EGZ20489.1 hypothetical protein PHYSODRAFT_285436 [Phytophthora sojae]|eukprot:XP_009523200.1 hypothetical protein PHYSODRAFT_285435 [Phytophthora sojae]